MCWLVMCWQSRNAKEVLGLQLRRASLLSQLLPKSCLNQILAMKGTIKSLPDSIEKFKVLYSYL